jgi:hypothetical protein
MPKHALSTAGMLTDDSAASLKNWWTIGTRSVKLLLAYVFSHRVVSIGTA